MELKEAIENLEKKGTLYTNLEVILAAARRDLARQEAGPKEDDLAAMESACIAASAVLPNLAARLLQAAVHLKTVREIVVNRLRRAAFRASDYIDQDGAEDLLRALGESVP